MLALIAVELEGTLVLTPPPLVSSSSTARTQEIKGLHLTIPNEAGSGAQLEGLLTLT